ncbi:MAG TPA: chromosome partitioning protein ParB, partial [Sphingomicrobium sp.]|nr:chromosome partitioning protein ParB [Sphingomicrobium sp.]
FAHCAAGAVNALWEPVPKHGSGRVSAYGVERRIEHANVLARAVGFDMVATGWRPTVENYLGRVTKPRILEAVAEGTDPQKASLIDHLKKGDMAREAERLLAESGWLPEPLRLPVVEEPLALEPEPEALPAFLDGDADASGDDDMAIAAE